MDSKGLITFCIVTLLIFIGWEQIFPHPETAARCTTEPATAKHRSGGSRCCAHGDRTGKSDHRYRTSRYR